MFLLNEWDMVESRGDDAAAVVLATVNDNRNAKEGIT